MDMDAAQQPLANELLSAPVERPDPGDISGPVSPMLHTAVLVVLLLVVSLYSSRSTHSGDARVRQYLVTMVWEVLLVLYVVWGLHRRNLTLRQLIGGKWDSIEDALLDIAIAAGFWIVAAATLALLGHLLGLGSAAQVEEAKRRISFLAPHGVLQILLWALLSATAGFCEEIVFRGYLQRQFLAWTRSPTIGIILSALVFGAAHGYEGFTRMIVIAAFGALFGVLAHYRKSLRPGMVAHAWHDFFSGILLGFMR